MTKSIEEMEAELKAEGYSLLVNYYDNEIFAPDDITSFSKFNDNVFDKEGTIRAAYVHLLERRELAALQALRDEIPHPVDYDMAMRAYTCGFCDASHEDDELLVAHADDCAWAIAMKFKVEPENPID